MAGPSMLAELRQRIE
jgi:hypothetical protein